MNARIKRLRRIYLAVCAALPALAVSMASTAAERGSWVEAFQSSPADYEMVLPKDFQPPPQLREAFGPKPPVSGTVRWRFAVAVGGQKVRIRLSNEAASAPMTAAAASVALAADGLNARPGTVRPLTFGGNQSAVIPAGAPLLSDPVDLPVTALSELLVSVYTPSGVWLKPVGGASMSIADGNQTLADTMSGARTIMGRPIVTGAQVLSHMPVRVIVALGDSITDGNRMKIGELRGWPEELQRRLVARKHGPAYAVVNAGIGGNRVLASSWGISMLARLDRDALRINGVTHIILLEGINDIGASGQSPIFGDNPVLQAEELIAAYRQAIARAHARGIKLIIGTLLPFAGAFYASPEREQIRLAVNQWIRGSKEPDAVIDFEDITRDSANPARLSAAYDSGDHLHPSEAGYKAMGDAIDLALFR